MCCLLKIYQIILQVSYYEKCPRCQLNYIEDHEDYCDVCLAEIDQNGKQRYNKGLALKNEVHEKEIKVQITANQVFQAVRYLSYNYGEYSIYDTENQLSYRNVLNKLLSSFRYGKKKYDCGAGFAYVFDEDEIWNNYFLVNDDYREIINRRKLNCFSDLLAAAKYWHSLPYKSRRA